MQQVGFSLIEKSTNTEVRYWGNDPNQCSGTPNIIQLPNGDMVHAPGENYETDEYKLVKRYIDVGHGDLNLKIGETISFDGTNTIVTYEYREPTVAELQAYNAAARYNKEISGIQVDNLSISTDRVSQSMMTGIMTLMSVNPAAVIDFKTNDGFIQANASVMSNIALAVAQHVQDCFKLESQVAIGINSNSITTMSQVDSYYA